MRFTDTHGKTVFITGPTGSGKSDLAMQVARAFNGEIVCADSQTVRRGMDIGTAKPTAADRAEVPHHMLDVVDPHGRYTLHDFKTGAERAIADIARRGKLPIIVGGSGLYVYSLLYDFSLRPSASEYQREELDAMSVEQLQAVIAKKGYELPKNERNPRHLIRTIEAAGVPDQKHSLREGAVVVGIDPGKEALEQRIAVRAKAIVAAGLVQELQGLLEKYGRPQGQFDGIEYRVAYENMEASEDELVQKLVIGDRQYAKKQRAWFRRNQDIMWFANSDLAYGFVAERLRVADN